jgi:NADH:ubiquinone oxidoreductase subunit 3 (subunit A)
LFILPKLLNFKEYPYFQEKKPSYEYGFEPVLSAHKTFDIRFIVVVLLLLLFDFELLLLFPYAIDYNCGMENFGPAALINLFLFLFILLVGFVYKCLAGAMLDGLVSP